MMRTPLTPNDVHRALLSLVVASALGSSSLLVVCSSQARANPPRALDAASFLRRVDARHPQAEASAAAVAAAEAEVTAAGTWENPVLSFGREEVFSGDRRYPEHLLRLEAPFEISGRRRLRVAAARLGVRAARPRAARNRSLLWR